MKVKVLRTFAFNKNLYSAGKEAEFQKEEVEHINSASHKMLVKVIDMDDKGEPEQASDDILTEQSLEKLTKKKLVEIAKEKGIQLDEAMTKKEMIKELI